MFHQLGYLMDLSLCNLKNFLSPHNKYPSSLCYQFMLQSPFEFWQAFAQHWSIAVLSITLLTMLACLANAAVILVSCIKHIVCKDSGPMRTPSLHYEKIEKTDSSTDDQNVQIVKHPLQHTWTLWYFESDKRRKWEENQREVIDFNTVEDFWCLFNHIKPAGDLKSSCDYSVFKKGIQPMWEDDANKNGGRWLINIDKPSKEEINMCWLELVLCMIGEAFDEYSNDICGAVVSIRAKAAKIGLWTARSNDEKAVMYIGSKLKDSLKLHSKSLFYQTHKDTVSHGSSIRSTYQL